MSDELSVNLGQPKPRNIVHGEEEISGNKRYKIIIFSLMVWSGELTRLRWLVPCALFGGTEQIVAMHLRGIDHHAFRQMRSSKVNVPLKILHFHKEPLSGRNLSGKGAAVFAEGLSGAVASGLGKVRYLN